MKRTSILLASLPLAVLAACGGSVVNEGNGGSGSSGSGASTSGTSGVTSGTSSTSGVTSSTSGVTSSTSGVTSSASSSGGGGCVGSVDILVGTAALHFGSNCAADTWNPGKATTPAGYLVEGGAAPGVSNLELFGCASEAAQSQGLSVSVPDVKAPGMFTGGTAIYTDAGGAALSSVGAVAVTITTLGAVGDPIEGTISTLVGHPPSQIAESLTGTFKVCHIGDQLVP